MLKKSFIFNLFLAGLVLAFLLVIFFNSLAWLTNHGRETKVPKLQGKILSKATDILEDAGFEVQIDSTYQPDHKPLEVIFQEPAEGSVVKYGRTIFLTVNRKTPPSIPMPNLVGISFRNAVLTLHSNRLEMGDTIYRPDLAAGSVLEQQYRGRRIAYGTMIPVGSRIDLVIAEGFSGQVEVPNLIGMTWFNAKKIMDSLFISPNALWDGVISDSLNAIVYSQDPTAVNELDFNNVINQGDLMDIHIMQNPSPELLMQNQGGSRQLLGLDDTDSVGHAIPNTSQSILPNKPIDDSTRKKHPVIGTSVPDSKKKAEQTLIDLKSGKKEIKPAGQNKPPVKKATDTKVVPVKPSDNPIKDEYN